MRQRATFRELIPKPVRHAVQDAKRARIPFVLFGCGRHQRAQYVLHQLHEHRPVLYIPPVQRIEAVSPVHVREIYIIELMGVSVFPDQVVCSPGIVKILEVIDETGESGPDVLFHQRFAYGFGLAGTGSSIDKEIGEPVIISDNCPVRGVKGEQGFSTLSAFCPSFKRKTKKYGNDTRKQEPPTHPEWWHVRQLFLQVPTAGTGHVTSGIFPETDSWQCRRQKAGLPVS